MSEIAQHSPARTLETIDFPSEGELVFSPHYTVRVQARGAQAVEVSLDAGDWRTCRSADGYWWYDWKDYGSGEHIACARVTHHDGSVISLRPRAFRVALPPAAKPGLHETASPLSPAIQEARRFLAREIDFVQLWFTDIGGKPWRIALPVDHLDEAAFTAGITLDGPSTAKPFRSYIKLMPDPEAIFLDPLATIPTAAIICDVIEPPDMASSALGTRQVLRSATRGFSEFEAGLSVTLGAEPEFFLHKDGVPATEIEVWDFICDLAGVLGKAGIRSEGFRFGPAPGQGRVQMHWADPVRTADHVVLYRWFAQVLAQRRGKSVSFHASPSGREGVAAMPVHHQLWRGNENAFHASEGWEFISDQCRWYVGGMLSHIGALSALTATCEDSYPLRAGSNVVPLTARLAYEEDAVCRIPARMLQPAGRRLKFRSGSATCNPYTSLAAAILAGLDGLKKREEPATDHAAVPMPRSLSEALQALDRDRDFLRAGGFGDRLIDAWIEERRADPRRAAIDE